MRRIIFDNTNHYDYFEKAKKTLYKIIKTEHQINIDDITDDEVYDFIGQNEVDKFTEFEDNINKIIKKTTLLIMNGTQGLWNGKENCGYIFSSYDEFQLMYQNADYISIYDEDGTLTIETIHHDGRNIFRLKKITEKGKDFLRKNKNTDKKNLYEKLFNTYSSDIFYAKKFQQNHFKEKVLFS